jgi:hypothetical protein
MTEYSMSQNKQNVSIVGGHCHILYHIRHIRAYKLIFSSMPYMVKMPSSITQHNKVQYIKAKFVSILFKIN